MGAATDYYQKALERLEKIAASELPNIEAAAEICANSIAKGGLVFLFGSGHSRMMCEEMTPRQGGFVGFFPMVEHSLSNHAAIVGSNGLRAPLMLEKVEGYAEEMLKSFKFGPHDAFIIISTSGIRPVIVEMALGAKARGLPVIAIVSVEHSSQSKPAHSSGKKLMEIADVTLNNHAPPGDTMIGLEGLEWGIGPASTVTGAMVINMLRCATAEKLLQLGVKPVVLPSHQFVSTPTADTAEEQLEHFYEAYRKSLAHLYQ